MRAMKDSGIAWVGDVPIQWEAKRNKYNFILSKDIVGAKWREMQLLSLTKYGIRMINDGEQTGKVPTSFSTYQKVSKDDIVMCLFDLDCSAVFSGRSGHNGMISPAYKCFKCEKHLYPQYADYYFRTVFVDRKYMRYSKNVRYSLSAEEFLALPILVPPMDEQKRIADFLDRECGKIDSIIADVEKQIELLKKYKRSVIFEAVTKGLEPSVQMKDSGIKWIGNIPCNWNVDKIKYHLRRNEKRNPGNQQVLSVYREYGVIPKDSRDDNHNVTSEDVSKYKYVRPGSLVINKMKAWQGSLAVSDYEGIVSPAYFIFEFMGHAFINKYLHYLLRGAYKDEFRRISGGIREGQWDLSPDEFMNTLVTIPPVKEQEKIISYIDKKCAEMTA